MKNIISISIIVIILSLTIVPCFAVAPSVPVVSNADIGVIGAIADSIGLKVTAGDAAKFWKDKIEAFEDIENGFIQNLKSIAVKNWSIVLDVATSGRISRFFSHLQTEENFGSNSVHNLGGPVPITSFDLKISGLNRHYETNIPAYLEFVQYFDTRTPKYKWVVIGTSNSNLWKVWPGPGSASWITKTYKGKSYSCYESSWVDIDNVTDYYPYGTTLDDLLVIRFGSNQSQYTITTSNYNTSSPYGEVGIGYDYQINIRNLFPDESIDNYETKEEKLNYVADKVVDHTISVEGQDYYAGTNVPESVDDWTSSLDTDFVYTDDFDTSVSIETPIEDITVIDPFTGVTTPVDGGFQFPDLFSKFHFIIQIKEIIENLFDDITTSQRQPPSMIIDFSDSEESYLSNLGEQSVFNLNWYAKYKPYVDSILSGILWIFFLWRVYKSIPAYFGSERITEENEARGLLRKGGD